jgi:hypothetical protein
MPDFSTPNFRVARHSTAIRKLTGRSTAKRCAVSGGDDCRTNVKIGVKSGKDPLNRQQGSDVAALTCLADRFRLLWVDLREAVAHARGLEQFCLADSEHMLLNLLRSNRGWAGGDANGIDRAKGPRG